VAQDLYFIHVLDLGGIFCPETDFLSALCYFMPTPTATASRAESMPGQTVMQLVDEQGLTFTDIISRLGLNQRTVKHRLELPWLFNVVELGKLAKLLEYNASDLFQLVTAQAVANGEFNPDKLPKGRRAGRPRRPQVNPTPAVGGDETSKK
jgi:hypothetical protein